MISKARAISSLTRGMSWMAWDLRSCILTIHACIFAEGKSLAQQKTLRHVSSWRSTASSLRTLTKTHSLTSFLLLRYSCMLSLASPFLCSLSSLFMSLLIRSAQRGKHCKKLLACLSFSQKHQLSWTKCQSLGQIEVHWSPLTKLFGHNLLILQ